MELREGDQVMVVSGKDRGKESRIAQVLPRKNMVIVEGVAQLAEKILDVVLSAAETLFERFGVRTLMTNMDPIPEGMADREFVDAYPECSREEYETALRRGDLAICASDHETMPRTPSEQAASGQVLVAPDAALHLARHEVGEAPHPLDGPPLLVQRQEVNGPAGGHLEQG